MKKINFWKFYTRIPPKGCLQVNVLAPSIVLTPKLIIKNLMEGVARLSKGMSSFKSDSIVIHLVLSLA